MIAEPLSRVLEATGYLSNGKPAAPSVTFADTREVGGSLRTGIRLPSFEPEAWWRSNADLRPWGGSAADLTVYFKYVDNADQGPRLRMAAGDMEPGILAAALDRVPGSD